METQNSKEKTSKNMLGVSADKPADKGVKVEEKRQKTPIRKNALYSDQALAVAKRLRGGE